MTQDPTQSSGLSAEKVAELEHRLADAAAEVARVQAQLAQAQGGQAPSTPPPAVPYGAGQHAITINGQPVTPGSGDLTSLLQGLRTSGQPPVVLVNGQDVSGGQPLDLSAFITPEVSQQLQSSLQALGLDSRLGALFGHPGSPPPPAAPDAPLAEPPRPVPMAYRAATFDLSWYELFLIVILTAAPVAVWFFFPVVVPAALLLAVLTIGVFRGRRYRRRIGLLKWGKVATVTNHDVLESGTYYGGMTYNNMRKRSASGWDMTTQWYSGPGYTNKVDYTLDGVSASLRYRGLLYTNGVVLADSRKPTRSMTVEQFPYHLRPGPDGQFRGELSVWQWMGIIVTLVVELTLVVLAYDAVLELWVNR